MVVTLKQVQEAMARMGRPSDFGELPGEEGGAEPEKEEVRRVLRRSLTDRSIAGVCGGLARFFSVDATLIRLLMLLLILCGGLSIWAYVVLWIVIPEEPARPFTRETKTNNPENRSL